MCSLLFLFPFIFLGLHVGRTCAHSPLNTAHVPMQCAPHGLEDACDLDVAILVFLGFVHPLDHNLSLLPRHDCGFNLSMVSLCECLPIADVVQLPFMESTPASPFGHRVRRVHPARTR